METTKSGNADGLLFDQSGCATKTLGPLSALRHLTSGRHAQALPVCCDGSCCPSDRAHASREASSAISRRDAFNEAISCASSPSSDRICLPSVHRHRCAAFNFLASTDVARKKRPSQTQWVASPSPDGVKNRLLCCSCVLAGAGAASRTPPSHSAPLHALGCAQLVANTMFWLHSRHPPKKTRSGHPKGSLLLPVHRN
eukprot:COSAG01_NODE_4334_length_5127_cov_10.901750_7_plen_197_part_01